MSTFTAPCNDAGQDSPDMESSTAELGGLNTQSTIDWSECAENNDEMTMEMDDLHISPLNKSSPPPQPVQFLQRGTQEYRSEGSFQYCLRPGKFAVIAIDRNFVVGVLDTVWFKCEQKQNWHRDVLYSLERAGVNKVYCCGFYVKLKREAGDLMNVHLDPPELHTLRYPCNICQDKECAVQKAYLYWRKINKRRPCNLEH